MGEALRSAATAPWVQSLALLCLCAAYLQGGWYKALNFRGAVAEVKALAARISGPAQSAYPNGIEGQKDGLKSAENINVIAVADTDLLSDRMWVQVQDFFGQRVPQPFADNAGFAINALDNLAGSDALISVRSRGRFSRPFEVVEALQREAEAQFRVKEEDLQKRLAETDQKLASLQQQRPAGLETEVFAYGRMPLAFSARCFTARHYNRPKDDCGFACIEHPDGQLLQTREGEGFLVLNGIQTQSARVHNLLQDVPALRALGVDLLRLSPQSQHMAEVIAAFDAARHAAQPDPTALERMRALMPAAPCNGYWHGKPGLDLIIESAHA